MSDQKPAPWTPPFRTKRVIERGGAPLGWCVDDAERKVVAEFAVEEPAQWLCDRLNAAAQAPGLTEEERDIMDEMRSALANNQLEFGRSCISDLTAIISRLTGARP